MITRYLVSYDIADPDRLRKVHAVVKACAQRVQYSVYEALMTETERVLLEERLKRVINQKEDQVIFLDLGSAARSVLPEITTLGLVYRPQSRGSVVL
jgi:CRISPR-associated protein Cas2